MRLPRVRFTVRGMMVAVAAAGAALGAGLSVHRARLAGYHSEEEVRLLHYAAACRAKAVEEMAEASRPGNAADRSVHLAIAEDFRGVAERCQRRAARHHEQVERSGGLDRMLSRFIRPYRPVVIASE